MLSTVDMVVQRRDGPRRLRDHDDDDDADNSRCIKSNKFARFYFKSCQRIWFFFDRPTENSSATSHSENNYLEHAHCYSLMHRFMNSPYWRIYATHVSIGPYEWHGHPSWTVPQTTEPLRLRLHTSAIRCQLTSLQQIYCTPSVDCQNVFHLSDHTLTSPTDIIFQLVVLAVVAPL